MERCESPSLGPIALGFALLYAVLIALALGLGGAEDEYGLGEPLPPARLAEGAGR